MSRSGCSQENKTLKSDFNLNIITSELIEDEHIFIYDFSICHVKYFQSFVGSRKAAELFVPQMMLGNLLKKVFF